MARRLALAQRPSSTTSTRAASSPSMKGPYASLALGAGICTPRLFRKMRLPRLRLSRGPGSGPITAKYQKKICNRGGMLRKTSM